MTTEGIRYVSKSTHMHQLHSYRAEYLEVLDKMKFDFLTSFDPMELVYQRNITG